MAHTTMVIEEKRMTGIIDRPSVPFSGRRYEINNAWQELVDGDYILVFAGALATEPAQGILIVFHDVDNSFKFILAPIKGGRLRIVDAKGYRLVIQQANVDTRLYFDVPAMSFATSLNGELVPTTTSELFSPEQTSTSPYPPP